MEICTYHYRPFVMGGNTNQPIKTNVEEFERIDIGKGYYGILIKNPVKDLWHMGLDNCGCMIGTHKDRDALIAQVKEDVETGDEEIMKEQIESGRELTERAEYMEPEEFFKLFRE